MNTTLNTISADALSAAGYTRVAGRSDISRRYKLTTKEFTRELELCKTDKARQALLAQCESSDGLIVLTRYSK